MLDHLMRHFRRYQEIISILVRNGFGFIIADQPHISHKINGDSDLARLGQRISQTLGELGPTFIKIGQFASTRPDLIPKPIIRQLEELQDNAPMISFTEVKTSIEKELGSPLDTLFHQFNPFPLATASIGQVHQAFLPNGEPIVVKIQRPNIMAVIQTDLEILSGLITLAEQRFPFLKTYALSEILAEFSDWLQKELNYVQEGHNAELIRQNFIGDSHIIVPQILWDLSSERILSMTYIDGTKLNEREELSSLHYDRKLIARRLSKALFQQIIRDGLFHGDPHPGNIFVLPDEKIAFVDFGIVGHLSPELKHQFVSLLKALTCRNTKGIINILLQLGLVDETANLADLEQDLEKVRHKHFDTPLNQISLTQLIHDFSQMGNKYRIELPKDFILLGKVLLTLEGILHDLDPGISIAELAKPLRYELIKEKIFILRWIAKLKKKKKKIS